MVFGGPVEGRGDDLALHGPLHVGDLFGALVDEHDHEVDLGVVRRDRGRDLLQDDRLAGLGRRDDQTALALSDGRDEVDDALRELLGRRLQAQALLRVERRELAELDALGGVVDRQAVDGVDLDQRVVLLTAGLLALARLLDGADDGVALAKVVLLDLAERHVDVARPRQVAGGAHESVVVEDVEDAGDRDEDVVLADLGLELVAVLRRAPTLVALSTAALGLLVAAVCALFGGRSGRSVVLGVLRALTVLGVLAALTAVAAAAAAARAAAAGVSPSAVPSAAPAASVAALSVVSAPDASPVATVSFAGVETGVWSAGVSATGFSSAGVSPAAVGVEAAGSAAEGTSVTASVAASSAVGSAGATSALFARRGARLRGAFAGFSSATTGAASAAAGSASTGAGSASTRAGSASAAAGASASDGTSTSGASV